jgi:hypothetical protein
VAGYDSHVHPSTVTGAPPPLPRTSPFLIAAAYAASTRSAVAQFTGPLTTSIVTGTPAAVLVLPQDVPVAPPGAAGEHPPSPTPAATAITAAAAHSPVVPRRGLPPAVKCRTSPIPSALRNRVSASP